MTDFTFEDVRTETVAALNEPNALARLRELGDQVTAMREQMRAAAKEALADGTKAIFAEYGDLIHQFGWIQYTPFFADGDPCEFGMHELNVIAKEDLAPLREEYEIDPEDEGYELYNAMREQEWTYGGSPAFGYGGKSSKTVGYPEKPNPNYDERYAAAYDACMTIYEICAADGQQIALDTFGDHCEVIFTPEGVDVQEYEHE
jgi:hypothetical protein